MTRGVGCVSLGVLGLVACLAAPCPARAQTPVLVKDINPGAGDGSPYPLFDAGGTLLFGASDVTLQADAAQPSSDAQIWRSDGTAAGTSMVKAVSPYGLALPGAFVDLGGKIYFDASSAGTLTGGATCRELWTTDTTPNGTTVAATACPDTSFYFDSLAVMGGRLYFAGDGAATGRELWTSDGTQGGTHLVRDIATGTGGGLGSGNSARIGVLGNKIVFAANDGSTGYEPWVSDGSSAGSMLLVETVAGITGAIDGLSVGGRYAYYYDDSGRSIWRTDGTTAGTIRLGTWGGGYAIPGVLGEAAFFNSSIRVSGGNTTVELWRTDGTTAGTAVLKTFMLGTVSRGPQEYVAVGNTLYFTATTATEGTELWKTDGTMAGTVLVKDIRPGTDSSSPGRLAEARGLLYFVADDGVHGYEAWRSDGTDAGTVMLGDIAPGAAAAFNPSTVRTQFVASGTRVYFQANDGTHGIELWAIDVGAAPPPDGGAGMDGGGTGAGGRGGAGGSGAGGGSGTGGGGGGGNGGTAGSGATGGTSAGGTGGSGGGAGRGGASGSGGTGGGPVLGGPSKTPGGCGCALAAPRGGPSAVIVLSAAALLRARRRRRV